LPAGKRKQCHEDSDVGIQHSREAESSKKKSRVDDYFVKTIAVTKASSATLKEGDYAGLGSILKFLNSFDIVMPTYCLPIVFVCTECLFNF